MKSNSELETIISRLDSLITSVEVANRLLTFLAVGGSEYVKDRAIVLLEWKFKPKDVASLLQVPIGTVTKAKSRADGKTSH